MNEPILRKVFPAAQLMREHPPRLRHANKRLVFDLACPPGAIHSGEIEVTRWRAEALPASLPGKRAEPTARAGFFDYAPGDASAVEWHLNFADPRLFCAYGGRLLAQDELQVAEHPALGAIREALEPLGHALTEDRDGATPVLVAGVERRCALATGPSRAEGRPHGLYGNAFACASPEQVKAAVRPLAPPTRTHLVAIAAPVGRGEYSAKQIERVLQTAFTGFAAAHRESMKTSQSVIIHTGFWGCGAFGGNRVLMIALQVLAARLAGVGLAIHWGDASGEAPVEQGMAIAGALEGTTANAIGALADRGFEWGVSDGN